MNRRDVITDTRIRDEEVPRAPPPLPEEKPWRMGSDVGFGIVIVVAIVIVAMVLVVFS